ncbi:MAG: S9 family peptidase, partial [Thermoanaerobaculia bacterium]
MKRALLFLFVLLAATVAFADKRFVTEKDIFRFVWIGDPQIAPDGSRVVFTRVTVNAKKDGYDTALWTVATRGDEAPRRLTNGPHDSTPRWSPDGKQIAFLRSVEKDGKPQPPQIHLLSLAGGEPQAITSLAKGAASIVWSPRGDTIAFSTETTAQDEKDKDKKSDEYESDVRVINQAVYRSNGQGYLDFERHGHIWTVRPFDDKPQPKEITSGEFDEDDVTWSPDGSRLYFTSERVREAYYNEGGAELFSAPAAGGEMVRVTTIDGDIDRPAVSPDGKWVAFRGTMRKPVRSYNQDDLFVVSTTPGSTPRNLTASFDNDVLSGLIGDQRAPRGNGPSKPVWSADSKALMLTTAEKGTTNLVRLDAASGAMTPVTTGNHDVQAFTLVPGKMAVVLLSTPTIIGDLYRVDANGALARLTNVNGPLFDEISLTEPEEIWYPSFDGKRIETWIQKPPDFQANKKYPMILNIHGGPHAAYGYTFDHEFQWMAAKGYVVLYPNPRGSTTYGQDFGNSIQYAYPGDDYKDLMAGVDELIKRGMVDEKKLGVTGGSGGGILTNWIVTQTDRFAAAVAQRSIADWSDFWYTADFTLFHPTWFHKAPWQDRADFEARSPITYIEKVHTPLMLIEGESDYRTPPTSGGEQMFRALKYLHRPTVMVRFPGESHELSRSGKPWHRVERLEHIVNWFDR